MSQKVYYNNYMCNCALIFYLFQNNIASFNVMGDSQNVIDVKVAGASVFTVDYFGNLNFASAITTIRNASTLRYEFFSAG